MNITHRSVYQICVSNEDKRNVNFREGSDEEFETRPRIRPVPRWTDRPTVAASCRCSSSSTSDGPDARCLEDQVMQIVQASFS